VSRCWGVQPANARIPVCHALVRGRAPEQPIKMRSVTWRQDWYQIATPHHPQVGKLRQTPLAPRVGTIIREHGQSIL
jgi:hypothetical protein